MGCKKVHGNRVQTPPPARPKRRASGQRPPV